MTMVWIKYLDSSMMPLGTHWLEDLSGPLTLESVGWLVTDTPEHVTLCMDYNHETKGMRFVLSIPRVAILDQKELLLRDGLG